VSRVSGSGCWQRPCVSVVKVSISKPPLKPAAAGCVLRNSQNPGLCAQIGKRAFHRPPRHVAVEGFEGYPIPLKPPPVRTQTWNLDQEGLAHLVFTHSREGSTYGGYISPWTKIAPDGGNRQSPYRVTSQEFNALGWGLSQGTQLFLLELVHFWIRLSSCVKAFQPVGETFAYLDSHVFKESTTLRFYYYPFKKFKYLQSFLGHLTIKFI